MVRLRRHNTQAVIKRQNLVVTLQTSSENNLQLSPFTLYQCGLCYADWCRGGWATRGQMGGVLLCTLNVMQLYSCRFTVSVGFSSKQEVLICDAHSPPSMQKFSFRPQFSLAAVMVVGRLVMCPSLSPVYTKLSVCLSVLTNWQK